MNNSFFAFINQPYPFFHKGKELIKISLLIFTIGLLFEYFIIPFERNPEEHRFNYFIISVFHVGTATSLYFLYFLIVSNFINEEDWKVYKEIIAIFFLLGLIGIGEWLIRGIIYNNENNYDIGVLLEEVIHAYLSGSIVLILVFTFIFNVLKPKNIQIANQIKLENKQPQVLSSKEIIAQIPSDNFTLQPSSLICAKADGNYVEFYMLNGANIKKEVKRITLANTFNQLKEFTFFQKTHRAFMINLNYVEEVNGNAQGYQLKMKHLNFTVPVSRNQLHEFNKSMQ